MTIFVGGQPPLAVYLGGSPVTAIYRGNSLIWPPDTGPDPTPVWDFYDDFERATLGTNWVGTGAVIYQGTLRKSTTQGNARVWINQTFDSDDIEVEVTIGTTMDAVQLGEILIGSGVANDDYVRLLFSKNSLRADQWTGSFTTIETFSSQPLDDGDVINLRRIGQDFTVTYNGTVVGTFSSSVAMGADYRRVALAVNMDNNFFVNWFGPTFDDVAVLAH